MIIKCALLRFYLYMLGESLNGTIELFSHTTQHVNMLTTASGATHCWRPLRGWETHQVVLLDMQDDVLTVDVASATLSKRSA